MKSNKFKRLAKFLPTVLAMTHGVASPTMAAELSASDYVTRIITALSSGDLGSAHKLTEKLRHCGVEALVTGGSRVSLQQIDYFIREIKAGKPVQLPALGGQIAFVVATILQPQVDCKPSPPVFVHGSLGFVAATHPSST